MPNNTKMFAHYLALIAVLGSSYSMAAEAPQHYQQGSVIDTAVFVTDKTGSQVSLQSLFAEQPGKVNVVFIFGGGDMGAEMPGHLWCQDSFEDTHILRTLVGKYQGKEVGFVAVASAPVYHSGFLGAKERVFLDAASDAADFKEAQTKFVDSTLISHADGILPIEPYFDLRFRLMLNPSNELKPGAGFGEMQSWHGAFRSEQETQFYGVPSFWLIADDGTVLAEPFRGNLYHPHGADVSIHYTFKDVDAALAGLVQTKAE
jgi:hypothetical protein